MIAALIIALAAIAVIWWIGYTVTVFGRVAIALSRAIAALAVMIWTIAGVFYAIAASVLTRRPALKPDDETNVIQFRRRG